MLTMVRWPSHHEDAISEADKRRRETFAMQDDGKGGSLAPKTAGLNKIFKFSERRAHLVVEPRSLELPEFDILVALFVVY